MVQHTVDDRGHQLFKQLTHPGFHVEHQQIERCIVAKKPFEFIRNVLRLANLLSFRLSCFHLTVRLSDLPNFSFVDSVLPCCLTPYRFALLRLKALFEADLSCQTSWFEFYSCGSSHPPTSEEFVPGSSVSLGSRPSDCLRTFQ